jgi:hypothetical protein
MVEIPLPTLAVCIQRFFALSWHSIELIGILCDKEVRGEHDADPSHVCVCYDCDPLDPSISSTITLKPDRRFVLLSAVKSINVIIASA